MASAKNAWAHCWPASAINGWSSARLARSSRTVSPVSTFPPSIRASLAAFYRGARMLGQSRFDFSAEHTRFSVERSLKRLHTDRIELVLVHSDGNDVDILRNSGVYQA